jgi:predicted transcriptional regulator of viral defense system
MLRTRDLIELEVHTDALQALRESGRVVSIARGLYRLGDAEEAEYPDLEEIAVRAPDAAVGLISARSYHGITTQVPSSVHLAVPRWSYYGIKLSTSVTVYRFDVKTFAEGLEIQRFRKICLIAAEPTKYVYLSLQPTAEFQDFFAAAEMAGFATPRGKRGC